MILPQVNKVGDIYDFQRYGVFNPSSMTPYQKLLKSATWAIDFSRPQGTVFPTLAPRTLPNGASNGAYLKNVSDDYVVPSLGPLLNEFTGTNVQGWSINFADMSIIGSNSTIQGKLVAVTPTGQTMTEAEFNNRDLISSIGKFVTRGDGRCSFIFPVGTTLAQAQTALAGTVIRYQLATPIDTLNSGQINPIQDLVGNADVTMNQASWTTADGFATAVAPNGKTVVGFQADGINTYGVLPSNAPGIDIQGTGDFALGGIINISTQKFQYLYSVGNPSVVTAPFFGLQFFSDGRVSFREGSANGIIVANAGILQINVFTAVLVYRKNGRLKFRINNTELYNQANTAGLQTSNLKRLCNKTNNSDGTTHNDFFNGWLGSVFIINNEFDETKLITAWDKYCAREYGL